MSFFPDDIQQMAKSAGLDLASAMKTGLAPEIEELLKFSQILDNLESSDYHHLFPIIRGSI